MKKQGSTQQQYKAKEKKDPNEYQPTEMKKAKTYNDDAPPKNRERQSKK